MRLKTFIIIVLFIVILPFMAFTIFKLYLPHYISTKILPDITTSYNIPLSLKIRQIGLFKSDISAISLGIPSTSNLQIDSLRLDYSLAMLRQRKINKMVINGLIFNAKMTNGKLLMPDFINKLPVNTPKKSQAYNLPFSFDEIIISQAILHITRNGRMITIPWSLRLTPGDTTTIARNGHTTINAGLKLAFAKMQLAVMANFNLEKRSIHLKAQAINGNNTKIACQGIPTYFKGVNLDMQVQELKATPPSYFKATGRATIKLGGEIAQNITLSPLELGLNLTGNYHLDGNWHLDLNKITKQKFTVKSPNLTSVIEELNGHGQGNKDDFSWKYNLELTDTKFIKKHDINLSLAKINIYGDTNPQGTELQTSFSGTGHIYDFNLGNLHGSLPLNWPDKQKKSPGELSINDIHWRDLALGNITIAVSQREKGFDFTANYDSALLSGLCLDLGGRADLSQPISANFNFHNACSSHYTDIDLGEYSPKLNGYNLDADIEIKGGGSYRSHIFKTNIMTALHKINLRGENFSLAGGDLAITFPSLLPRSNPAKFTFRKANLGDIAIENGLLEFQIESPSSILLEKSRAKWCNGHIYTQAARFSTKRKDYDLTIYCDQLNVAQLLKQFGAATAEGEGRITGKIPIKISNGRIIPQEGFLYSTPGQGGTIRLSNTERLTAGIPPGTPKYAQIDLAREALKDFSYNWTSIDLSGQEDDLLLHLQIDGKPTSPLPFVYNKDFGGFMRVKADNPGSRFQGIKLDVNFRLPLNQILHLGNSMKGLMLP